MEKMNLKDFAKLIASLYGSKKAKKQIVTVLGQKVIAAPWAIYDNSGVVVPAEDFLDSEGAAKAAMKIFELNTRGVK